MRSVTPTVPRTRRDRRDRLKLQQQNPPAMLCMTAFTVGAVPAFAGLIYADQQYVELPLSPAAVVLVLATIAIGVKCLQRKRIGRPPRRVSRFVALGMFTGICCVGASVAARALASEAKANVSATFLDSELERDEEMKTQNSQPDKTILREPASRATDSGIEIAKPIVLPAGTRMECQAVSRNEFEVRVESLQNEFQLGLRKSDFEIRTTDGRAVPFSLTEVPSSEIAVPCHLCIVIDESLVGSQYAALIQSTVDTVLNSTSMGSYRLVSGGSLVRVHLDWSTNKQLVLSKLAKIPASRGNAFPSAVSLSLSEIRRQPSKRILVAIANPGSPAKLNTYINRYLRDESLHLLLVGHRNSGAVTVKRDRSFKLGDLDALGDSLARLTTRHVAPCYRIRVQEAAASQLKLTVGSGDTSLSKFLR